MNARDLLRLVISNLSRMKGRVVMTAIGVVIGTAAVVVLISLASGLQQSALRDLSSIGPLTDIRVYPLRALAPFGAPVTGREGVLDERALAEFRKLPGVVAVTPKEPLFASFMLRYGRLMGGGQIVGVDPGQMDRLGFSVSDGAARLGSGQVIVGARVAEIFFDPRVHRAGQPPDLLGQTLQLVLTRFTEDGQQGERTVRLRVTGVLEKGGSEDDYTIFMSLPEVLELNGWYTGRRVNPARDGYSQALVKVARPDQVAAVEREIQRRGFYVYSAYSILRQLNSFFLVIQGVLGGIGAIALLVAAFGIANTMLMSIYERTREIGLMKAIGATNRDVMSVFLAESGSIGLLGGLGGVLVGIVLSLLINVIARTYLTAQQAQSGVVVEATSVVHIPLWLPFFAALFATGVGVLSGVYPATRAASLDPIAALRHE
ncbi:MAG: ABC transporter permease [Anaerolineae bacterium]|nr:ABC transporter permease [Anaerolineae bacterium]MDW8069110.1 ABC transporter permease [Anaerolineae bacterium]